MQEVNNNVITMAELQKNASKYFGYDVFNYAETLPENLQDTKWQLFYAGAIEGEIEQRIYLISKEYVKNTVLPAKDGRRPIAVEGSEYKAMLDRDDKRDGVLIKYTNLLDVSSMKKYIKDYFKDYSDRVSPNTKSTSYMLDTSIWQPFASSTQSYAEWAIGGPTVELLLIAYNKYAGTAYETTVASQRGYQVRKTSTDEFSNGIGNAIDEESLYIAPNITDQDDYYWIASPFNAQANMIYIVSDQGGVGGASYNVSNGSFRPIVLLNSNFQLEKVKDTNNKEAFKIVSK